MAVYIFKRLLTLIVVMLTIMVMLSLIVHMVPGDPARRVLGPRATPEVIESVRAQLGLDLPIHEQVFDFVRNALRGDLGRDFTSQIPVTTLIWKALPDTLTLALAASVASILVGIPMGMAAARRPDSWLDRSLGVLSIVFLTGLSYVVGLLLLLVFSVQLGWFPALGAGEFSEPLDYLKRLVLPSIALAVSWWGYIPRLVRASVLDVMGSQYIRTARAFGFSEGLVFYKYALRNALIPVVSLLGLMLGYMMAGTIFVELIFSRPGLGTLALSAIGERNWPVIRGIVLVYAIFFTIGNFLSDVANRWLDPRIREESATGALA